MREDLKDLVKEALELNSRLKKDKARLSELKNTILSESEGSRTLSTNAVTPDVCPVIVIPINLSAYAATGIPRKLCQIEVSGAQILNMSSRLRISK